MPHYNDGEYDPVKELDDSVKKRETLNRNKTYIVDTIFPAGSIHVISGPSGSGKTTWLMDMLRKWSQGQDVLGYKSNPCPWVYVSCDRSLLETDSTMRRLGLGDWRAPMHAIEDVMGQNEVGVLDTPSIFEIEKRFPHAQLIVIEGLQSLLPDAGRGMSANKSELHWLIQIRKSILSKGKTIIATTHSPKSTVEYANARSNMLGTQSLIGGCSTLVQIDIPRDVREGGNKRDIQHCMDREVVLLGRDYPDHYITYTRKDNGEFDMSASYIVGRETSTKSYPTEGEHHTAWETRLRKWNASEPILAGHFKEWAEAEQVTVRTIERWRDKMVDRGKMKKGDQRGIFMKAVPS